jgi:hypothetical protein
MEVEAGAWLLSVLLHGWSWCIQYSLVRTRQGGLSVVHCSRQRGSECGG